MKKIVVSLLFSPIFSYSMDQQGVDNFRRPALTFSEEAVARKSEKGSIDNPYRRPVAVNESNLSFSPLSSKYPTAGSEEKSEKKGSMIEQRALDNKKVSSDEEIDPDDFLPQFRNMFYVDLKDPEMKALLITSLQYALLNGHKLCNAAAENKAFYQSWDGPSVIIHAAQQSVADIIESTCARHEFRENMQSIADRIDEKYQEEFVITQPPWVIKETKKVMEFCPADATQIYMILSNFDVIAGTTRKDMVSGRDQLVARRLSDKIKSLYIKDGTEMQPYVDARAKFKSTLEKEEAKKVVEAKEMKNELNLKVRPLLEKNSNKNI